VTNSLPRTGPSVVSRDLPFQSKVIQRVQTCLVYAVAHPSVCLSSVCNALHPTQPVEIFGNVSTPFSTLVIR